VKPDAAWTPGAVACSLTQNQQAQGVANMGLSELFQRFKGKAVDTAVGLWLRQKLKRYGTMTTLQIDSKQKTIHMELELKGETSPIVVDVENYELLHKKDETFLSLNKVSTSREWMTVLLRELLPNQQFKVPNALKIAL
jgi:hypothetical protein